MAKSYRDTVRSLLDKGSQQFPTKGTDYDRVFVETEAVPRMGNAQTRPLERCRMGATLESAPFLTLIDAYITGSDDNYDNWQFIYRIDVRALAAELNLNWEALLAKDGLLVQFPSEDNSADVTWTFTIVNPDSYTKPTQGVAHPTMENVLFINESWQRDGQTMTVTRHYRKVAPINDQQKLGYQVTYEYRLPGDQGVDYPVVTWTYDTPKEDFTNSLVNATCGIAGFTELKVIKPASNVALDGLNLRVTVTYGKIPGPLVQQDGIGDGPGGQYATFTWRRPYHHTPSTDANLYPGVPVLNWQVVENNGYCVLWSYTQLRVNDPLLSAEYRPETGETFPVSVRIVPAGTEAQIIGPNGDYTTIEALNKDYSVETARKDTGLATGQIFKRPRLDGQTGELYPETEQIIEGDHGSAAIGEDSVGIIVQQLSLGKGRKLTVMDPGLANKKKQFGAKFDPNTGRTRQTWRQLVPNETPGMDISVDGEVREVSPIDSRWALMTSEFVHGYVSGQTRPGYYTYEVFPLPGVLRGYFLWNYDSPKGIQIGVNYYIEEKTSPLLCFNEETWYRNAPPPIHPTSINGSSLQFSFPGGGISIPECLHIAQLFTWADGDGYVLTHNWPATTHIDWPATIVLGETKPFMGGFLQTKKTLYVQ